jgi:hypothetical protein
MPFVCYRIVEDGPPTIYDMSSHAGRGQKPPGAASPELLARWGMTSVYDT